MRSDDLSWPIRLADLNKCYDSCNYVRIFSIILEQYYFEIACLAFIIMNKNSHSIDVIFKSVTIKGVNYTLKRGTGLRPPVKYFY